MRVTPTNASPIQMPLGSLSPYGAEVAALLKYVDANKGSGVDGDAWARSLADYFNTSYAE